MMYWPGNFRWNCVPAAMKSSTVWIDDGSILASANRSDR
jgi:hypothetical protein